MCVVHRPWDVVHEPWPPDPDLRYLMHSRLDDECHWLVDQDVVLRYAAQFVARHPDGSLPALAHLHFLYRPCHASDPPANVDNEAVHLPSCLCICDCPMTPGGPGGTDGVVAWCVPVHRRRPPAASGCSVVAPGCFTEETSRSTMVATLARWRGIGCHQPTVVVPPHHRVLVAYLCGWCPDDPALTRALRDERWHADWSLSMCV